MNRQQKETIVADFQDLFQKAHAAFLVNYKGVDVAGIQSLRSSLRKDGALFKVTKARLMKKAAQKVDGVDKFSEDFKDQVGLVFALGEVPGIAKKLVDFSSQTESFKVVSGFFESKAITQEQIKLLAALPSRDVLLAQVASTLQAPMAGLARVLQLVVTQMSQASGQTVESKSE